MLTNHEGASRVTLSRVLGSSPSPAGGSTSSKPGVVGPGFLVASATPASSPRQRKPFAEPTPVETFPCCGERTGAKVDLGGGGGGRGSPFAGAGACLAAGAGVCVAAGAGACVAAGAGACVEAGAGVCVAAGAGACLAAGGGACVAAVAGACIAAGAGACLATGAGTCLAAGAGTCVAAGVGACVATGCGRLLGAFAGGGGGGTVFRPAFSFDPLAGGSDKGGPVSGRPALECGAGGVVCAGGGVPLALLLDREIDESSWVIGARWVSRWLRR